MGWKGRAPELGSSLQRLQHPKPKWKLQPKPEQQRKKERLRQPAPERTPKRQRSEARKLGNLNPKERLQALKEKKQSLGLGLLALEKLENQNKRQN